MLARLGSQRSKQERRNSFVRPHGFVSLRSLMPNNGMEQEISGNTGLCVHRIEHKFVTLLHSTLC